MTQRYSKSVALALAAAAVSGLGVSARAGETTGAVTVSLSGSTALRNFTISPDFTALTPGTSILINGQTYTADASPITAVQLAASDATAGVTPYTAASQSSANFLAYRVEWHEQGSVEGIAELVNDQIGTINSVSGPGRNPVAPNSAGVGNRVYINGNAFTAVGTVKGFALGTSTYNTYANYNASGSNLQGGQNRVQLGISDVRTVQGFSVAGTGAFNRTAGQAGYGKGNPVLLGSATANNLLGLGDSSVRRQLIDSTALNMDSGKIDPKTGVAYVNNRPWNTAGVANTDNKIVAITATTFAANPGTGLTDLNKTDAQWLQTTGRLSNGADFNVTTRDINSGTLNVAANNVGIDPSFAVGENDSGNGLGSTNEALVGSTIRFSGKTAGGAQLRPTVQNARMAIGHLSLSDVRGNNSAGSISNPNQGANPLRALGFRQGAADTTIDPSTVTVGNPTGTPYQAVQPSFATITDGTYALFQNETYVTIKDPTNGTAAIAAYKALPGNAAKTDAEAWAALTDAQTGAKGDVNVTTRNGAQVGDVTALRNNVLGSTQVFPAQNGIRNPAAGLLSQGFIPPNFMKVQKAGDGEAVTSKSYDTGNYSAVQGAYGGSFEVGAAASVTTGTGAVYGGDTTANILITPTNYLFGDFNGDGKRDFQDLKYAQNGQQTLNSGATDPVTGNFVNVNWKAGVGNGTSSYTFTRPGETQSVTFSKGDLIVKGDYNADGNFDGRDLYAFARGASLADGGKTAATLIANPDTGTLTVTGSQTISDRYRSGTLYKNAALDYLQATATAAQKSQATANATNDATGANAFNKFDVNRDGRVTRQDAGIVDGFVGKDYTKLADQLGAVVATNVNAAGTVFLGDPTVDQTTPRKGISLVDAELNDTGDITVTVVRNAGGTITTDSDFSLIRAALGPSLLNGDSDFDGGVSINDFNALAGNFGKASGQKWSTGDYDFDGGVSINDFNLLAGNFGLTTPLAGDAPNPMALALWGFAVANHDEAAFIAATGVPEPTSLGLLAAAGTMALRRRRR